MEIAIIYAFTNLSIMGLIFFVTYFMTRKKIQHKFQTLIFDQYADKDSRKGLFMMKSLNKVRRIYTLT